MVEGEGVGMDVVLRAFLTETDVDVAIASSRAHVNQCNMPHKLPTSTLAHRASSISMSIVSYVKR